MKIAKNMRTSRQAEAQVSPTISFEKLQRDKVEARLRDQERIARREATPEELQRENSIFTHEEIKKFKFLNLEETLLRLR